jgi:hypothetical protein
MHMRKLSLSIVLVLLWITGAAAQSNPNFSPGPLRSSYLNQAFQMKQDCCVFTQPQTWNLPQTFLSNVVINATTFASSAKPNRGPLFVWGNPANGTLAGQAGCAQFWMGDNPTAFIGSGTQATCVGIGAVNGNGRGPTWAVNILAAQSSAVIGAVQGPLTGVEIDASSDPAYVQGQTPFQANPVTNLQLYNSPAVSMVTNAITIWNPDGTGNFWFWEGISMSRYKNYALHFYHLGSDPASVATLFDESNAAYSYRATGSYTNAIDLTSATIANNAIQTPGFSVNKNGEVALTGPEGNQLDWFLGGQIWAANMASGGSWYIEDVTNTKFPIVIAKNGGVIALTGSSIAISGTLGIPQVTWTDTQTCTTGQISVDASFIYVCTSTNVVKRATLASF